MRRRGREPPGERARRPESPRALGTTSAARVATADIAAKETNRARGARWCVRRAVRVTREMDEVSFEEEEGIPRQQHFTSQSTHPVRDIVTMLAIAPTATSLRAPLRARRVSSSARPALERRCTRSSAASSSDDVAHLAASPSNETLSRRRALRLAAAAAAAQALFADAALAAYETQTAADRGASGAPSGSSSKVSADLSVYRRSFRERFETSISSGTHDYAFSYPAESWRPDIVSLNDGKLYGVDLRFSSPAEGKLCTHVLPFVGEDSLRDVGTPEVALDRFVELIGAFWNENGFGVPGGNAGTLEKTRVKTVDGVTYYLYETTKPRNLIAAAVTDGQLYVINAAANDRQWAAGEANLRAIVDSFYVPP